MLTFPDKAEELAAGVRFDWNRRKNRLDEFLANTPNLNGLYEGDIELVEGQFEKEGFSVPPITVLKEEDYARAMDLLGNSNAERSEGGESTEGHTLINMSREDRELYGGNHVLHYGLHETAHSIARRYNATVISREYPARSGEDNSKGGLPNFLGRITTAASSWVGLDSVQTGYQGGFLKLKVGRTGRHPEADYVGHFWDEAYADLKRVRSLRELERSAAFPKSSGRSPDQETGPLELGDGITIQYLGGNTTAPLVDNNLISLPVEFAACSPSVRKGRQYTPISVPAIAAYGVELLDRHMPGLFEDFETGQWDGNAQSRFIKKVNSIQPNLYKDLQDLPYTAGGFSEGLIKIAQALHVENGETYGSERQLSQAAA
jgi:hypothetical protein